MKLAIFVALASVVLGYAFQNSDASAVLHLTGKIVSFDAKEVTLETKTSLYKIDRKALVKSESDRITRSEVQASLNVPMSAIKTVENRPKK
jgi:hypothetical protein